jgi:hypothetical protein
MPSKETRGKSKTKTCEANPKTRPSHQRGKQASKQVRKQAGGQAGGKQARPDHTTKKASTKAVDQNRGPSSLK